MSKTPTTARLFKLSRARSTTALLDAADLGTCFGLEVSLDQTEEDPPAPTSAARRAGGWLRRLTSRPRTPT